MECIFMRFLCLPRSPHSNATSVALSLCIITQRRSESQIRPTRINSNSPNGRIQIEMQTSYQLWFVCHRWLWSNAMPKWYCVRLASFLWYYRPPQEAHIRRHNDCMQQLAIGNTNDFSLARVAWYGKIRWLMQMANSIRSTRQPRNSTIARIMISACQHAIQT